MILPIHWSCLGRDPTPGSIILAGGKSPLKKMGPRGFVVGRENVSSPLGRHVSGWTKFPNQGAVSGWGRRLLDPFVELLDPKPGERCGLYDSGVWTDRSALSALPPLSPPGLASEHPVQWGLLRLAAVGGLFPLQTLLAAGRRRPRPQALKPAALGADADVRAPAGRQRGLPGQSLRQLVGLPGAAQLAVAERRCAPGGSLLRDRRAEGRHPRAPPA